MPLKDSENLLAQKIANKIALNENRELVQREWEKIIKDLLDHLINKATIIGKCDGKPLIDGKIT